MTRAEAKEVLGDVRAYLASRASLENEMIAGHTFIDVCNAIKALKQEPKTDMLDTIRAEIMLLDYELKIIDYDYNDMAQNIMVYMICREEVLQIIDEHKAKTE